MANKNGRKGAQFETDVLKWLRSIGFLAERLTKAGAKDEGDIVCVASGETYILELKNRKALNQMISFRRIDTLSNCLRVPRRAGCLLRLLCSLIFRRMESLDSRWVTSWIVICWPWL